MNTFRYIKGEGPLLITIAHAGAYLPDAIRRRLTGAGKQMQDTDWHVDRLYAFARKHGIPMLVATHSRYVIDLNRRAGDDGRHDPDLCPRRAYGGESLYRKGFEPHADEVEFRVRAYWEPFHRKIAEVLDEFRDRHGFALLWDAHSLDAEMPGRIEERLAGINLATHNGDSAHPRLGETVQAAGEPEGADIRLNAAISGGFITQEYGRPDQNWHAIECTVAKEAYLSDTPANRFDGDKAGNLRPPLERMVLAARDFNPFEAEEGAA